MTAWLGDLAFKACCAAAYGSDLASLVLGPSFHPGGRELTRRLARMACLRPGERVLDVASGAGGSALLLAEEFDVVVHGVDLSPSLVAKANESAIATGRPDHPTFEVGDAEHLAERGRFDTVFCECAMCTFPDKETAARGFVRALRTGGRVCLADVVVDRARLPEELAGLAGRIACVAEALPLDGNLRLLEGSGLRVCGIEHHDEAVVEMAELIDVRLAFLAAAGGESLAGIDVGRARGLARAAAAAARDGIIGYVLITAELELEGRPSPFDGRVVEA